MTASARIGSKRFSQIAYETFKKTLLFKDEVCVEAKSRWMSFVVDKKLLLEIILDMLRLEFAMLKAFAYYSDFRDGNTS